MPRPIDPRDIGLRVLQNPQDSAADDVVDIVAVHGMGAHPNDTWCTKREPENSSHDAQGPNQADEYIDWLSDEDMLPKLVPNARILRFGYHSQGWGKNAVRTRGSDISNKLILALAEEREESPDRPLIFIAHSYGGLVVLHTLLEAKLAPQMYRGVYKSVIGLVFFSTPFRGTDRQFSHGKLLEFAEQLHGGVYSDNYRIFSPGNYQLLDVVDKFLRASSDDARPRISCFFERKKTDIGRILGHGVNQNAHAGDATSVVTLVDEHSGCLDTDQYTTKFSRACDHLEMNKFKSKFDEGFRHLEGELKRMLAQGPGIIRQREGSQPEDFSVTFHLYGAPDIQNFVAREQELDQIHNALTGNSARREVTLHGLGGIGKTQLAIAYAKRYIDKYSAIFWLNAKDEVSLKQSFGTVANVVRSQHPSASAISTADQKDDDAIVNAVKAWLSLRQNTRWLLIYDNYDNPKSHNNLSQFLPAAYQGCVIITSRSPEVGIGHPIHIGKIENINDCLKIIANASGREDLIQNSGAEELAEELDGLPLALATAGLYLRGTSMTIEKYLSLYKSSWPKLQETSPVLDSYKYRTLYSTWQLSFDHIKKQNERAANLLCLWAYFDNQDLWLELLQHAYNHDPEWIRELVGDDLSFTEAIRVLSNYGLVEATTTSSQELVESRGYSMHNCVHTWTRHALNQPRDKRLEEYAIRCVALHIPHRELEKWWLKQRRLVQHVTRCSAIVLEGGEMRYTPSVYRRFGMFYVNRDQLPNAEVMYRRALEGYDRVFGPEHTTTLSIVQELGDTCLGQNKLSDAETLYWRALLSYKKTLGPSHIKTIVVTFGLYRVHDILGKHQEAQNMAQKAYRNVADEHGPNHPLTLDALYELGLFYAMRYELKTAEAISQQVLQGYKRIGLGGMWVIAAAHNLISLCILRGKPPKETETVEKVLEDFKAKLGPNHPSTLKAAYNLGRVYLAEGRIDESEKLLQGVLRGFEAVFEPDYSFTLDVAKYLGYIYTQQEKFKEAETMYLRAIEGYTTNPGPQDNSTLDTFKDIGYMYDRYGKPEKAEPMYLRALQGYTATLGSYNIETLKMTAWVADFYTRQNRHDQAEKICRRAYEAYVAVVRSENIDKLDLNGYIEFLWRLAFPAPQALGAAEAVELDGSASTPEEDEMDWDSSTPEEAEAVWDSSTPREPAAVGYHRTFRGTFS